MQVSVAPQARRAQVWAGAMSAALEGAVRQAGATSFPAILAGRGTGAAGGSRSCPCGGVQESDHYATRSFQTVLGAVRVRRAAYRCAACGRKGCPLDEALALPEAGNSPRLEARQSRLTPGGPPVDVAEPGSQR